MELFSQNRYHSKFYYVLFVKQVKVWLSSFLLSFECPLNFLYL